MSQNKLHHINKIKPLNAGGMKMQDLDTKIEANKLTWIKNIKNTSIQTPWKSYLQEKSKHQIETIPLHNIKYNQALKYQRQVLYTHVNYMDKCNGQI